MSKSETRIGAARELWHQTINTIVREHGNTYLVEANILAISVLANIPVSKVRKAAMQEAAWTVVKDYNRFAVNAAGARVTMPSLPDGEDDFAQPRLTVIDKLWPPRP